MSAEIIATAMAVGVGKKVGSAAISQGLGMLGDISKGDSLVGYAELGNIEPTTLVDEDLRGTDSLPDVLQLAQSIYMAYFLRAFSMHNISIGNATIGDRLGKFATRRNPTNDALSAIGKLNNVVSGVRAGMEEFDDRLPVDGDDRALPEDIQEMVNEIAMEEVALRGQRPVGANTPLPVNAIKEEKTKKDSLYNPRTGANVVIGKTVDVTDPVSIATGRMVNVTIKEGNNEVIVPIHIRLAAFYMQSGPLAHILAAGSDDISFGARFKKWRLGGIDFWRDLVMCQDLIDEHKKNLKKDTTGMYLQMMQRRKNNNMSAAITGSLSANSASNIIIMSKATADEVESRIFGKLKDFQTRQKLFKQGYCMLMFIVDKQWGSVKVYTRDIDGSTELSEKDIKQTNKGGGVDIGDVLNSFRTGMSFRA